MRAAPAGRMIGALMALACIGAAQPPAALPPLHIAPERGHFSYRPLPLDRALALFRSICMDSHFDGEAVERAVLAAGLGYTRQIAEQPGEMLWTSRYGEVYFRGEARMRDGRPMQDCDLRFAMADRISRRRLIARIGRALAPGRQRIEVDSASIWNLGGNFADRLQYARFAPGETRLIDLNRRHIYLGQEH